MIDICLYPFLYPSGSGVFEITSKSRLKLPRPTSLKRELDSPMTDRKAVADAFAICSLSIDRVFVVGAPSFFPTVFNWAKKWYDISSSLYTKDALSA